ncbi:hypothetical protein ACLKA6_014060 [Drosophila palustris]
MCRKHASGAWTVSKCVFPIENGGGAGGLGGETMTANANANATVMCVASGKWQLQYESHRGKWMELDIDRHKGHLIGLEENEGKDKVLKRQQQQQQQQQPKQKEEFFREGESSP